MTDSPKKRALIARNFKNEGTGESFTKGATPLLDAGTFANYEAAGLVTAAPPTKSTATTKSAKTTKPRTKAKVASKPKSKPVTPAADASAPVTPEQPGTPPAGGADPAAD